MADYAKITGNTTGHYDLYDKTASTTDGFAHTPIEQNTANVGLHQVALVDSLGFQKLFSVVIIKNTSNSVSNTLTINDIEILKNYDAEADTGNDITSADAFSITEYF